MRVNEIRFFKGNKEVVTAENNEFSKPLDGSKLYNVKPAFYVIDFTSANQTGIVSWNNDHTQATFTHTLNCYPIVTVYDSENELTQPIVTIIDGNNFRLDFVEPNAVGNQPWHCIVSYGCEYGSGDTSFSSQITSVMSEINEYMELATAVNDAIQEYNGDNQEY